MRVVDLKTWDRKEYYEHFSAFEEPYHGIVINADCTEGYKNCIANNRSFFATYMHKSLMALNSIEAFRYRICNGEIVVCDSVHAGSTIGRKDGTFAFAFIPYFENEDTFIQSLSKIKTRVTQAIGMCKDEDTNRIDMIHYSTVPWLQFTGLTHARSFKQSDGIPKVTFGKLFNQGDKKMLPIAINAHHGFVDGYHIAQFVSLFEEYMNK